MNSRSLRWVGILLSAFGLFYFGYQVYLFFYVPYPTEQASVFQYSDQIELTGIAIKSEQGIANQSNSTGSTAGIVKYQARNAQKVSSGSPVATIYNSEADLIHVNQIEKKQEQLALLTDLEQKKATIGSNAQNVVANIKKEQVNLINQITANNYSNIQNTQNNLLNQLLRQEIVLNPSISFQPQIDSLNAEIASLQVQVSGIQETIVSPASGYFTTDIDGYEGIITKDLINDLSLEAVHKLLTQTVPNFSNQYLGKVVTDTEWYFLALIPTGDVGRIKQGQDVKLVFSHDLSYKISATVESVNLQPTEEHSVVLMKSTVMNDKIIDLRLETASILFQTGKGLRVPKEAVRMVEMTETEEDGTEKTVSQPGVYISNGQVVQFKKIDIVNETDNYMISEIHEDENDYLQLYDEIILEGTDLYDNKPIK